jgi:acyl-CoA-binding protein
MATLQEQFDAAVKDSKSLRKKPDDETLLEIYSYYKQATEGDATGSRPGAFDFVGRAKYDAWKAREGMGRDVAMKAYVKLIAHLKAQG